MAIKGIFLPRTKMPANGPWDKSWGSRSIIQFDIYIQFCLYCILQYFRISLFLPDEIVRRSVCWCVFMCVTNFDMVWVYLNSCFMRIQFTERRENWCLTHVCLQIKNDPLDLFVHIITKILLSFNIFLFRWNLFLKCISELILRISYNVTISFI